MKSRNVSFFVLALLSIPIFLSGEETSPKLNSDYSHVPGISPIPSNSSSYKGIPGISETPQSRGPFEEDQKITNIPGIAIPDQEIVQPKPVNPEREPIINDVRYGIGKILEKMEKDDPTLADSLATVKILMEKFRTVREDQDNSEYLRDLQIIQEAEKALARKKEAKRNSNGYAISSNGQQQLAQIVNYARSHHVGYSGGNCFNSVWGYLTSSGYGKLHAWGDLPNMPSGEARHFSEYLNSSPSHLAEAGLQRLDTALNPPITNPHDSRIPNGAVIVVAAGSYGTAHATAGDIVVKVGPSHFINDGPNMDYGTKSSWYGKVLGVYVPQ